LPRSWRYPAILIILHSLSEKLTNLAKASAQEAALVEEEGSQASEAEAEVEDEAVVEEEAIAGEKKAADEEEEVIAEESARSLAQAEAATFIPQVPWEVTSLDISKDVDLVQASAPEISLEKTASESYIEMMLGETKEVTFTIEVDAEGMLRLASPEMREQVVADFRKLGYKYVTLDLAGYRTGSMNEGLVR